MGGIGKIVLGKVDPRLDLRNRPEKVLPNRRDLLGKCPCHALPCGAGSAGAPRTDELHDALGAGKVNPSAEESAFRELARLRRSCPRLPRAQQYLAQNDRAAMTLQLDGVLARIGMRGAHIEKNPLVDDGAVRCNDVPVACSVRRGRPEIAPHRAEYGACDAQCVCAAHADDADAARPVRGGNLADGVLAHVFPFPVENSAGNTQCERLVTQAVAFSFA